MPDSGPSPFPRLHQLIRQAERILLISDGKPDGDSIGSTSAVLNWLAREGKHPAAFCAEAIPRSLRYLDGVERFSSDPHIFDQPFDLMLTFDASDLRHCGIQDLVPRAPAGYTLVNIDHHATNARFGQVNVVFTDACSTAEVVYRFFEHEHIPIDRRMATSILTGILTDTSSFSNAGTTSKGVAAAGRLIAAGARWQDAQAHLIHNKTVPGLQLWGIALSRLRYQSQYQLAWTYLRQEDLDKTGTTEEAAEGVSNFLNAACGEAETILVLREKPNGTVSGSLRSVKRDISKLAQALGGGGHKKAAGFLLNGRLVIEQERVNVE